MNLLRKILFPFSILYGLITFIRNFLYDQGVFKSYSFDIPIIVVGNLSVGGTGKSPQIEYLIRLLSPHYRVATLSRGYKRKSVGFQLADSQTTVEVIGDEPYQFYRKFSDIQVAVDSDRKRGIERLLSQNEKPDVILLDDAFQHRKVQAGFYVLLTAYDDVFYNDYMLPTGNLRENKKGVERADVIIVTKCPNNLSDTEKENIVLKINNCFSINKKTGSKVFNKKNREVSVFFTSIKYDGKLYNKENSFLIEDIKRTNPIALAGIAKPRFFFEYLDMKNESQLIFSDHHHFTKKDLDLIIEKAKGGKIITTEKDYVRLENKISQQQLLYLPIMTFFMDREGQEFDEKILDYVGTSTIHS